MNWQANWQVVCGENDELHVIPAGDERGHQAMACCWCWPTMDGETWVHHSADKREDREQE